MTGPDPVGWDALCAHIAAHPVEGPAVKMRNAFAALAPSGPAGRPATIGGVPCCIHGPPDGTPLVWLHGGGLVFGSPDTHAAMGAAIARGIDRPVILPDYRLAPENPWPAPLDDLLAVLDASDQPIDLGGDSAGGQLALLASLRRTKAVRRLALVSPNTDRTGASTTRKANTPLDAMNDDEQDAALARMSFGADLAGHPDGSPWLADLSGLPPVWITAATNEVLLDDTLLLIRALSRAGVALSADIRAGLCHLWPLWPDALPESRASIAALATFLTASD